MSNILDINIEQITPNAQQSRKFFDQAALDQLTDSIKLYGLLQPIIVTKTATGYVIIAGERRYRACKALNHTSIPCNIVETNPDNINAINIAELCLIENLHRENLNPLEEAAGYMQLLDLGLTQVQISERIGKSRPHVANMLRLLKLPELLKKKLHDGEISVSHALTLVKMDGMDMSKLEEIVCGKISVHQLRTDRQDARRKKSKTKKANKKVANQPDSDLINMAKHVENKLKIPVHIDKKHITLEYNDFGTLDLILEKLMK